MTSLGEATLDLNADYGPLKDSVGGAKSFVSSSLGTLGGIAGGVLAAGVGVAAGAFGVLSGAIGYSLKEAMEAQEVQAQLDAVLKSTGEAAKKQGEEWEAAQGKFTTSTKLSSAELVGLQDELAHAQAKLNDMQSSWDKAKTHTESGALALEDAKAKVAGLQAAIADGSQTITTSLANAMGLVPPVAQMTKEAILGLADSLSEVTRFGDEAIISGESMLLTFTNIGADVFPRVTKVMLDVSQAMGQDLKSSAIQLGKALNDPTAGMSALTRVGVTFTEEQKKTVKALQDTGDMAGAQAIILAELEKEFGGSAEAAGKTFAGQLDILHNKLSNIAEAVGTRLLPLFQTGLTALAPLLETLATRFADFLGSPLITNGLQSLIGFVGTLLQSLGMLVDMDLADPMGAIANVVLSLAQAFGFSKETAKGFFDQVIGLRPVLDQIVATFTNVGAFITGTALPALLQFATWLMTNIPVAQAALQPLIGAVMNLLTTVAASLPMVQTYFADMLAFIIAQVNIFSPTLLANLTTTLTTLTTFWQAHGAEVMAIIDGLFRFIVATVGGTLTLVSGIVSAFITLVTGWWSAGSAALHGDWSGALLIILTTAQTMYATLTTASQTFMNGVLAIFGSSLEEFKATWSGTLSLALQIATKFFSDLIATWKENWDLAVKIVTTFFSNLIATWKENWNLALTLAKAIWNEILDTITGFITSILSGVVNFAASIISQFNSLVSNIRAAFSLDWGAVGVGIISGIASGVMNAVGGLAQAAADAARAALQAAKDAIGWHSPPAAFVAMGEAMMLGTARGILSNADLAQQALLDSLPGMGAGLQLSPSALASNMALAGSVVGNTTNFTQTVYPSSNLDIVFLTRQVARELQRRQ